MPSNGRPHSEPTNDPLQQVGHAVAVILVTAYVLVAASIPVALAVWLWRLALER